MGTGGWHWVGTGGCTAGHRWMHCWAPVGGASGRTAGHRWAELVGALLGTGGQNLWVALLGTDHQGIDHQCPDDRCRSLL
ncbi:unnamed protein product [Staurois parvus]|uniref:Uncharacterized protein n=1 Tax=Staurois parvus TaxID=386267 RepID=A0ABN9FDV5_9NEOB|nr:unnamed protein product [Staurois parvus]